jgi:hypothetical protein
MGTILSNAQTFHSRREAQRLCRFYGELCSESYILHYQQLLVLVHILPLLLLRLESDSIADNCAYNGFVTVGPIYSPPTTSSLNNYTGKPCTPLKPQHEVMDIPSESGFSSTRSTFRSPLLMEARSSHMSEEELLMQEKHRDLSDNVSDQIPPSDFQVAHDSH